MMQCDSCKPPRSFCSPMHSAIFYFMGGRMDFDDRCQWCGCTLYKGYHESDCPVRPCQERIRRQFYKWRAESPAETAAANKALYHAKASK